MSSPSRAWDYLLQTKTLSHPVLNTKHKAMGHATVCGAFPDDGHRLFHPNSRACEAEVKDVSNKARSSESRREVARYQVWKPNDQLGVERIIS